MPRLLFGYCFRVEILFHSIWFQSKVYKSWYVLLPHCEVYSTLTNCPQLNWLPLWAQITCDSWGHLWGKKAISFVSIKSHGLKFWQHLFLKFIQSWQLRSPVKPIWADPSFQIVPNLLRVIEICHRGHWKLSSIFRMLHHSQKNVLPKVMIRWKKTRFVRSFIKKKFRKFWWKLMKLRICF